MAVNIAVNTLPMWSRFLVPFDLRWDGTNPARVVITRGQQIPVFNYKQGEGAVAALLGDPSTARDTILQTGAQTRGGALYDIRGISYTKDGEIYEMVDDPNNAAAPKIHAYWPGMSVQAANGPAPICPTVEDWRALEAMLLAIFLGSFRTQINIDGTRRILEMGPSVLYPGVGGNKDSIVSSNGDVFNSNYMEINEGITWNPAGAADSNLIVLLEANYNVACPCWTTPTGTANGLPVSGTNPIIPGANRTAVGRKWILPMVCNFHGREESPTSAVS